MVSEFAYYEQTEYVHAYILHGSGRAGQAKILILVWLSRAYKRQALTVL